MDNENGVSDYDLTVSDIEEISLHSLGLKELSFSFLPRNRAFSMVCSQFDVFFQKNVYRPNCRERKSELFQRFSFLMTAKPLGPIW